MNSIQKLITIQVVVFLFSIGVSAQSISRSIITFGGSEYNTDSLTLDATMGQVGVSILTGPYTLTQGFQQGDILNVEFPATPEIEAKVFPNPFEDMLEVNIRLDAEIEMRVYDVLGQVVYSTIPQTEQMMIRTSDWATGVYFVNFSAGGKRLFVEKVIKHTSR